MNMNEKIDACMNFYNKLAEALEDSYEVIGSCNQDISSYLIPKGTIDEISYYGKPSMSFRISDHWNWYSSLKKCTNEHYIQCYSVDAPWARKRPEEGRASRPIFCSQVAFYDKDNKYHVVFGEKFDRKTKTWSWIKSTPEEVIRKVLYE